MSIDSHVTKMIRKSDSVLEYTKILNDNWSAATINYLPRYLP